jgi:hypothetical protein
VRTATTANVGTYTATAGLKRSDNPTYLTELRLLQQIEKNSTNGAANGIYVVTTAGTELTVYGIELLILTQILR